MFKYLLKFIKFAGKQRKHMIIALVFGLLQSIFTAFSLLATAYALQNMIEGTATMSTVWSAFGIVGGGVLLAAVCNYFSTQFLTYAGYTIAANARIRIADKLKYAPMGYFNEHNLGQIANTATNTAESLQDTLTRCLLLTTKGLFMALVITISLLVFDWRIGLVAAAGFVLFLIINHFLHKAGEKNSDRKTVSGDRAVEAVLEYVQGIAVIKSYNLTGKANKKVTSAIKEDRDVNYALEKNYIPFMALQGIAVKLAGVAIIAVSVWFYTQLSMPLFTALVACIASFMVFNDLDSGGNMSALLRMAANSIDKIEAAMNLPVMDINGKEITPVKTDIDVKNVDFSYDKRKIIDGVTVDIPARSSLAIVGGSGSGKTTLCNLILRFWDVDKGSISLGGVRRARIQAGQFAQKLQHGVPERVLVQRYDRKQYPFRQAGREYGRSDRGCEKGVLSRLYLRAPRRVRYGDRRGRREHFGRRKTAHLHSPRNHKRQPRHHSGRGDGERRSRKRMDAAKRHSGADQVQNGHHDRAPVKDCAPRR